MILQVLTFDFVLHCEPSPVKVSNPYLYTKQGIFGVKIDGKQVLTAPWPSVSVYCFTCDRRLNEHSFLQTFLQPTPSMGQTSSKVGGKHRSLAKSREIAETAVMELRKGTSVTKVREMADAWMQSNW